MKKKPSSSLVKADHIVYTALKYFSYLSGIAVLAIMLLAFADVISSKVFGKAIPSATEWITYLNVVVVLPTLAYIQLDTGHINVELFSGGNRIVKLVIRVLSNVLGLISSALLGYSALKLTGVYFVKHTLSSSSALTKGAFLLWPFVAVFAVGFLVFALAIIWSFVREFSGLEIVNNPLETGPYQEEGGEGK